MKKSTRLSPLLACALVLPALIFSACSGQAGAPAAQTTDTEATIAALATANAQLSTQVAELSSPIDTPTPEPAPTAQAPAEPEPDEPEEEQADVAAPASQETLASPAAPGSTLPRLVANVALAPEGATLDDLRFDRTMGRIYATDTAGQLHVLDAGAFTPLTTLPFGGNLELDERNGRLYVYRPFVRDGEEPVIHVIDTATLAEVGVLTGGAIAVDSERNRLFVGEPYTYSTTEDGPDVRVIDGATLQVIGEIEQPGAPVYNPARDELLIAAYTVYTADPNTFEITGDLFPELTDLDNVGFLWCNGCRWVDNVWYLPEQSMVAVMVSAHCTGKGCGVEDAPRWFNAATMEEVDPSTAPELQSDCGTSVTAVGSIADRLYRNRVYSRYVVFTNFYVSDAAGAPITWRDGLSTEFINPNTGQGYLYDGRVIDLATIAPIGRWPAACVLGYDAARGLLYGKREGSLYVMEERGGAPLELAAPVAEELPDVWVTGIKVSPAFAADRTLIAEIENGSIFRSTDGGATWLRLQGGLPNDDYANLSAEFSPDFATDRTIYLTGHRGDFWGYGVYRSTDGGETWQPLWNNLTHLRGEELFLSDNFAEDQTLVVRADFHDVGAGVSGESYHQSTDGGLTWTLVVTGNYNTPAGQVSLPPVSELLPASSSATPPTMSLSAFGDEIVYTADGSTWLTATVAPAAGDLLLELLPSPAFSTDATAYAVSQTSIWRTTDGGATWTQWQESRFADPDNFEQKVRAAAITPLLDDGGYRLFLGTGAGETIELDPAAMAWGEPAAQASTATDATPALDALLPTPTPAASPEPLAGDPPADRFRPEGDLGRLWGDNVRIQQDVGWATALQAASSQAAVQRFDSGVMVWLQETGRIYAFLTDGRWFSYEDTFSEGDPEFDPALSPPDGRQQPMRGFGKVWREHQDLRDAIGWALAKEEPATALRHPFERGSMLRVGVFAYTMLGEDAGTWY